MRLNATGDSQSPVGVRFACPERAGRLSKKIPHAHAAGIWRIRGKPPPAAPPAEPARRRGGLAAGGLGDSWFNILEDSI